MNETQGLDWTIYQQILGDKLVLSSKVNLKEI